MIDEEHAPFNRGATDMALLSAAATGITGLARVARGDPPSILAALDDGAAGVMIPHVNSVEKRGMRRPPLAIAMVCAASLIRRARRP